MIKLGHSQSYVAEVNASQNLFISENKVPRKFTCSVDNNCVEIIDCLSANNDMQTGISIYNYLRDLMPENESSITRHAISTEGELWKCLDSIEQKCFSGYRPLIHLEAHANKTGFELRRNNNAPYPIILWSDLIEYFRRINIASNFNLGVFVATCEGIGAIRPMTIKKPTPYIFLVGPNTEVSADMVKISSQVFYTTLKNTSNIDKAFATLPREFDYFLAERLLAKVYVRLLRQLSIGRARKERINFVVNKALPENMQPDMLRYARKMAKQALSPNPNHFEMMQKKYLPLGVSFTFDNLLEFARSGKF